jgi:hypothetical protein
MKSIYSIKRNLLFLALINCLLLNLSCEENEEPGASQDAEKGFATGHRYSNNSNM